MGIPFWMRALRWYALHSPVQRGTYRLGLWLYQHFPVPDVEVTVMLDRTLWMVLRPRIWVDYNIYCLGLYEAPLARFFIRSLSTDSVVLDIGAYIGQYTLLAAKYSPAGRVIALEPHPESYQRLLANIALNRLGNVQALNLAAGQRAERVPLLLSDQPFNSRLLPTSRSDDGMADVEVVPVDQIVREAVLPRVDVMKIDVEGAEGPVLRGAYETLSRFHPIVIVELDRERERAFGDEPEEILGYLRDLGYAFYALRRRRLIPLTGLSGVGVTQLGPNWVILTAIYGVFWPITRHMWGSLPANCVSPTGDYENVIGLAGNEQTR
jgi:FkbM family methyltransferase